MSLFGCYPFIIGGVKKDQFFIFPADPGNGQGHGGTGRADQKINLVFQYQVPGQGRSQFGFQLGIADNQLHFPAQKAPGGIDLFNPHFQGLFLRQGDQETRTGYIGHKSQLDNFFIRPGKGRLKTERNHEEAKQNSLKIFVK